MTALGSGTSSKTHFTPERRVSSRTRWNWFVLAVERSRLAGSVEAPLLLAAAAAAVAAAAAARAVLDPTVALAARPTATAGGALEANKAERSAVTCLASSRAGARPSTGNGAYGSANDAVGLFSINYFRKNKILR